MKKVVWFLAALICVNVAWGQESSAEVKKQINRIKKSQLYLSAEATLASEEEALKVANELLVTEINEWVKTKRNSDKVQQIVLQDISSCSDKMNMKRGTQFRAFVYVKKSDIVLIKGEGQIILSDQEKGNDLQALSVISEPMKFEKEPTDSKRNKAGDRREGKDNRENIESSIDEKENDLRAIMDTPNMTDMKVVFANLKERKAIEYGTYPSDDVSGVYYLLFYTRTGAVKTIVRVENGVLVDQYTQKEVKLVDFSGQGAYWFNLK